MQTTPLTGLFYAIQFDDPMQRIDHIVDLVATGDTLGYTVSSLLRAIDDELASGQPLTRLDFGHRPITEQALREFLVALRGRLAKL